MPPSNVNSNTEWPRKGWVRRWMGCRFATVYEAPPLWSATARFSVLYNRTMSSSIVTRKDRGNAVRITEKPQPLGHSDFKGDSVGYIVSR
jgi:hypothetical protein